MDRRRFLLGIISVLLCGWAVARPQPNTSEPPPVEGLVQAWRLNVVAGDPERCQTYLWKWFVDRPDFSGVQLSGGFSLRPDPPGTKPSIPVPAWGVSSYEPQWYEPSHHSGFSVPAGTPAGRYAVLVNNNGRARETGVIINVRAPAPKLPLIDLAPSGSDDSTRLEAALAAGHVRLAAGGEYRFGRTGIQAATGVLMNLPVRLVSDRIIIGRGAVLKHVPGVPDDTQNCKLFEPAERVTFRDVTIELQKNMFWSDAPGAETCFFGCKFKRGLTGHWDQTDGWIHECEFDRAGHGPATSGLVSQCSWHNRNGISHAFWSNGAARLVTFNLNFDGTDRGLVFRAAWTGISDCLFCGTDCNRIRQGTNSGELVLLEQPANFPFSRNQFYRFTASGSPGPVNFWDGIAVDNLLCNFQLNNSCITFAGLNYQTRNVIRDVETIGPGGGIAFGEQAVENSIEATAVLQWEPSRGNGSSSEPEHYKTEAANPAKRRRPIYAYGPRASSNTIKNGTVTLGQDVAGVPKIEGVTVKP